MTSARIVEALDEVEDRHPSLRLGVEAPAVDEPTLTWRRTTRTARCRRRRPPSPSTA
jgi:hypothetical protein